MAEEKVRDIINMLIEDLKIKVEDKARERLEEGLRNSIRVLTFLSMMRVNDYWERLYGFYRISPRRLEPWFPMNFYPIRLDLTGHWYPVRTIDVEWVMRRDLPALLLRGMIPRSSELRMAERIEDTYKLSDELQGILFEKGANRQLSINSIAFEARVLNVLKKEKESIEESDLEELEDDIGKWFG